MTSQARPDDPADRRAATRSRRQARLIESGSDHPAHRPPTKGFAGPQAGRAYYPRDLAAEVRRRLEEEGAPSPPPEVLNSLFETLFYASLRTEENLPVTCTIAWMEPGRSETLPGQRTPDRWSVTRLGARRRFSVPALVKLSRAADPASSSLAVHQDADGLYIWGMVDQAVHYQTNDLGFEGDGPPERPGTFQATIAPAMITVYRKSRLLASLIHGQLSYRFHDVLHRGLIAGILEQYVQRFANRVRSAAGKELYDEGERAWERALRRLWVNTLSRILLGVQSYGHGGAVLLVERHSPAGMNVKYELPYGRLLPALTRLAAARITQAHSRDRMWQGYLLKEDREDLPIDLHLEEGLSHTAQSRCLNEITGCVRFVASLSQVDGAVTIDQELTVGGFGVEITVRDEPPSVFLAGNAEGTPQLLRQVDYDHFGTRHRSMMRYCWRFPGSVGFVVSQDGTVRALTRRDDQLLLWDTIHLFDPGPQRDSGQGDL